VPEYEQAERPLIATTPLGKDVLLATAFRGPEAISRLFHFQLDLLAEINQKIAFERLLGNGMTVEMRLLDGTKRYFNGLVKRFSQGGRDEFFVRYRAELVPQFWLLSKKVRSRIFQHVTVPDILRQLLSGLNVKYEISSVYHPRDFCVQYRESDFDFASRLMEEEGIYYFFRHSDGSHQMIVTDLAVQHPTVPGQSSVVYEEATGEVREEMRVSAWEKTQELRSGQYTLWDHCFEMPPEHFEGQLKPVETVNVGQAAHKLQVGDNEKLEIYDYPGGYAQRFDGVDPHGALRSADLKHIFEDRDRTVRIRMEQEQAVSLEIAGGSDCGNFAAGHQFTLERHFDADGPYLLTRVEHDARQSGYRSSEIPAFHYENHFRCIPAALHYRPQRETRRPVIPGVQTATVVGPKGEEIFCDKYGRVKVQFHWDREGKKDADSSCWLRVAQVWAGKRWGAFFWPRIGHEVVVAFEEGDPDQPVVIGSVYNKDNMPPLPLPAAHMFGGIKSASLRGKAGENYNSVVFVDLKGQEHVAVHSERHMILNAEYDIDCRSGRHRTERVSGTRMFTVGSLPGGGGSGGGSAIAAKAAEPAPADRAADEDTEL
jgi:type VI secretion system secreted protein VgrG